MLSPNHAGMPLIIAHRGASALAPENTLSAFNLAYDEGADGIELDAKLSADGHIMVIHDQTVDRTTGGHGEVRRLTLAEMKTLDAGSAFAPAFKGEPIPTLAEVFDAVAARMFINVELTNYASPTDRLPELVAELVKRQRLQERILFSSFLPFNLLRIKRQLPDARLALLTMPGRPGGFMRGRAGTFFAPNIIHPYQDDVTETFMQQQRRRHRAVNVWTVNDPAEMKRLYHMGIDGIITDNPRLARQVLEET